jgi:hypothetical protein
MKLINDDIISIYNYISRAQGTRNVPLWLLKDINDDIKLFIEEDQIDDESKGALEEFLNWNTTGCTKEYQREL